MIRFFENGELEITVPVTFTRPIIEGVTKISNPLGYVVLMDKHPNRFPNGMKSFKMHFLNWLADNQLQIGFGYEFLPDFPRLCLPMVTYLHSLNLVAGFDIDDYGFVTYDKDLLDESVAAA